MEQQNHFQDSLQFNESEWIRLILLLADTQSWFNELAISAITQIPLPNKKKLFRKTYYITITSLAHIIERHYYKIPRHPGSGKFTIPFTEVLSYLRDAAHESTTAIPGSLNHKRTITTNKIIGYDRAQIPTNMITIVSDSGGRIITAFPETP